MPWRDEERSGLAAIGARREIGARGDVAVIEAEPRRSRDELDPTHAVCGNEGRTFLGGAVNLRRNELTVPMKLLGRVGIVVNIDSHALAFG